MPLATAGVNEPPFTPSFGQTRNHACARRYLIGGVSPSRSLAFQLAYAPLYGPPACSKENE